MLEIAHELLKALHQRLRVTIGTMAAVAESFGAPAPAVELLQRLSGRGRNGQEAEGWERQDPWSPPPRRDAPWESAPMEVADEPGAPTPEAPTPFQVAVSEPEPAVEPAGEIAQPEEEEPAAPDEGSEDEEAPRRTGKRRDLKGERDASDQVRPLRVDDAIDGSTYLARIVWSLGVAELEGTSPLRPAEIARMIMARSPVSLEPPNVARYIRRSEPRYIVVDRQEGSSKFYALNDEGREAFRKKYLAN